MTNITIKTTPTVKNIHQNSEIELATNDPTSHLNIHVRCQTGLYSRASATSICMMPQDARALRDALNKLYQPFNTSASPFLIDPVKPNPFQVGDEVVAKRIAGYGPSAVREGEKGTISLIVSPSSVVVRFGAGLTARNVTVGVDYLTKVPNDKGTFIVALHENGVPKPSAKPHVHTSRSAAEAEAKRLAEKHGGDFIVYRAVTMQRRPKVVVPPVSSIKLD